MLKPVAAADNEAVVNADNVEVLERALEHAVRTGVHGRLSLRKLVDRIGAELSAELVDLTQHIVERVRGRGRDQRKAITGCGVGSEGFGALGLGRGIRTNQRALVARGRHG